jgi:Exopolysaccharide synthesis, ExoD
LRERWSWVFNPLMSGVLGLVLFLLGLASMAPIVGGGVQHAASAFLVALGMAERDGLAAMIGALAGMASIALAVLGVLSGKKLWTKIKAWLLRCARWLHLRAFAQLLDHCCEGIGDLVRLRWSGLLLLMFAPAPPLERLHADRDLESPLRRRVRRVRMVAERARSRLMAKAHGP